MARFIFFTIWNKQKSPFYYNTGCDIGIAVCNRQLSIEKFEYDLYNLIMQKDCSLKCGINQDAE